MNAIALPRIPILTIDNPLASLSAKVLGYAQSLDYHVANERLAALTAEAKLMAILAKNNAMPFAPAAVEKYKADQKFKACKTLYPIGAYFGRGLLSVQWHICRFKLWQAPIPMSVLDLAVALQTDRVPHIRMEYLGNVDLERVHRRDQELAAARLRALDPFLLVRSSDVAEWHRVAVWDEPDFNG